MSGYLGRRCSSQSRCEPPSCVRECGTCNCQPDFVCDTYPRKAVSKEDGLVVVPCFRAFKEWTLCCFVHEVRQNFVEEGLCGGAGLLTLWQPESKEEPQGWVRVEVYHLQGPPHSMQRPTSSTFHGSITSPWSIQILNPMMD